MAETERSAWTPCWRRELRGPATKTSCVALNETLRWIIGKCGATLQCEVKHIVIKWFEKTLPLAELINVKAVAYFMLDDVFASAVRCSSFLGGWVQGKQRDFRRTIEANRNIDGSQSGVRVQGERPHLILSPDIFPRQGGKVKRRQ